MTLPARLAALHAELGIDPAYEASCGLPQCPEPAELVDAGVDVFGRHQQLYPPTLVAWRAMIAAAGEDGIVLQMVSAYRSTTYQAELIRKKLAAGRTLTDVLRVNAAPGFSEHHSGRAIDIGTENCPHLEVEFEETAAFRWLMTRAEAFDFYLSYPRNHATAITYEPWHWAHRG